MAKPLHVSKWDTRPLLQDQSPGQRLGRTEGETETGAYSTCFGSGSAVGA